MVISELQLTRCASQDDQERPRPALVEKCAGAPTPTAPFGGSTKVFSFGAFRLLPAERLLTENGRPVRLGSRALDILVILVEHAGSVVAKNDIMDRVWPSTIVVEDNLTVHMTALRRVLQDGKNGNRYIVTIPGRGYSFVAQVMQENQTSRFRVAAGQAAVDAPTLESRREHTLAELIAKISRQQDSAIVEPDGFVRVPLPLALAEALMALCQRGSFAFDLADLRT